MTTKTKAKVIGYYNELEYYVVGFSDEEPMGEELYRAGNSQFDSQQYTNKFNGVGLNKMKQYCEQTTKEMAKESKSKYGGIEYEEMAECDK